MTKHLSIEGMTCGHCVKHVTGALRDVKGVTSVQVDLGAKSAVVDGEALEDDALKAAVKDAGYDVVAIS